MPEISDLKQHVFPAYDLDSVRFPNGICTIVRSRNVYRQEHWDLTHKFLPSVKLTQCIDMAQLNGTICGCLIGRIVQLNHVKNRMQMVNAWGRQRTTSKPMTKRICINCGSTLCSGEYFFPSRINAC